MLYQKPEANDNNKKKLSDRREKTRDNLLEIQVVHFARL